MSRDDALAAAAMAGRVEDAPIDDATRILCRHALRLNREPAASTTSSPPVTGKFQEFEAKLSYDPQNPQGSSVEVKIPVASVNTGNSMRNDHLRTAD